MFKKTEESEWTRFSRALGGTPPAAPPREDELATADEPEEPVTLAQTPPVEPEVYMAPPPPPAPVEHDNFIQTDVQPNPPTMTAPSFPPAARRVPEPESDETVIGDGATIDGTVRSDRSIRVRGSVQGEIECRQRVVVDESARVQARITAEQVVVLGEVNGAINCTGRVEIASTARVTGEVTAGTLVIQEGAFFEGSLKMANNRDDG
jgi:cytoskeletal protein CcmA (bactofilin family)